MTKAKPNPFLVPSNARLFAGLLVVPLSMFSIVLILTFFPNPLFAIFPIPTLIIGTAMILLELRNRIEQHRPIAQRTDTSDEAKILDSPRSS